MDCKHVAELLPWFLNGTLGVADYQQVQGHLEGCDTCRRMLEETKAVMAVYRQHIPAEILVDYVFKPSVETMDRALIERHLQNCRDCTEELAWVREIGSGSLEGEPNGDVQSAPKGAMLWRSWHRSPYGAVLAAGLIGVMALGWLWTWYQTRIWKAEWAIQQQDLRRHLTTVGAENQQWRQELDRARQEIAQLSEQLRTLASPSLQAPIAFIDSYGSRLILPAESIVRKEVLIPSDAKFITLVLRSGSLVQHQDYSIKVFNKEQQVVWKADHVPRYANIDGYSLLLPSAFLQPGDYTVIVYGGTRDKSVDSYYLRLVKKS